MNRVLALPVLATMFVLMVTQATLPIQTSEAASRITVPRDYPTIQAAIDAANPGDTIKVLPGTYREQIIITKDLKIVGSGAKSTVIKAPAVLNPSPFLPFPGRANIVDIFSEAKVGIKGLTITGPSGAICPGLAGIRVFDGSTLNLDYSSIKGCTREGMLVGLDPDIPNGPQVGHATVTNTEITQYRFVGIQAGGQDTTIKLSRSSLVAAADTPEVDGQVGVVFSSGAQGIIKNNKISGNICDHPDCGDDFENQAQGTAIFAADAASGSSISNNVISHNDLGIALLLNSGCCEVDRNILKNNRFFGIAVIDSSHTISNTKISGGNVGVLAVAFSVKTVATLDRVLITGVATPTQELSVGATAKVVILPRSGQTMQSTTSTLTDNPISFSLPTPGFVNLGS